MGKAMWQYMLSHKDVSSLCHRGSALGIFAGQIIKTQKEVCKHLCVSVALFINKKNRIDLQIYHKRLITSFYIHSKKLALETMQCLCENMRYLRYLILTFQSRLYS